MATTSNLGRVQGGGMYSSTSTSTTSIPKNTLVSMGITPLVGDIIVNADGDTCLITAITSTSYTVTKRGSIKGPKGDKGDADTSQFYTKQETDSAISNAIDAAITTVLNTPV